MLKSFLDNFWKKNSYFWIFFKTNTNTRESPSISICKDLLEEGARIFIYDLYEAQIEVELNILESNRKDSNSNGFWSLPTLLEAAENADAILILTEWDEFKYLDFERLSK